MFTYRGQGASDGIAIGKIHFMIRRSFQIMKKPISDIDEEISRFTVARAKAVKQLALLYTESKMKIGEENSLLFQIHQMMLEDMDYNESVIEIIRNQKVCAEYAVNKTAEELAKTFSNMEDDYMRGRASDVKDVSSRVISILSGIEMIEAIEFDTTEPFILAAEDLSPSETVQLNKGKILAILTSGGTATSHTAIFARTMGIPAVIGLGENLKNDYEGKDAALDGRTGDVFIEPDIEVTNELLAKRGQLNKQEQLARLSRGRKTITKDGQSMELCANIGSPDDLEMVFQNDAEGIGLFRSEFLYLEKDTYPTEAEQFEAYKNVAEQMRGKRVVIRTLDIGADKQAGYFNLPKEENPAMGLRAIRICLTRPDIFKTQLRALYRASYYGKIAIMFPMITSVEEVRRIKAICVDVQNELKEQNIEFDHKVELGIMIETPAAAIISDDLAKEVDFFSVGTNDLTQYVLAIDRQNPNVTEFCNTHHKAILRMIQTAAKNAHEAGIWIGICGELASDESLTEEFLQMGIDELSVTPSVILRLRAKILEIDLRVHSNIAIKEN